MKNRILSLLLSLSMLLSLFAGLTISVAAEEAVQPEAPAEEVSQTEPSAEEPLSEGNTIPRAAAATIFTINSNLQDGDHIIFYNPSSDTIMGSEHEWYGVSAIRRPAYYGPRTQISVPEKAAVLTVADMENGQFRLTVEKEGETLYLSSSFDGSSLVFSSSPIASKIEYGLTTSISMDTGLWRLNTTTGLVLENVNVRNANDEAMVLRYYSSNTSGAYFMLDTAATTDRYQMLIFSDRAPCTHANTTVTGAVAPTCIENGYSGTTVCSDCGSVVAVGSWNVSVLGHDLGAYTPNNNCTHTQTCQREGCTYSVTASCAATLVAAEAGCNVTCSVCGDTNPRFSKATTLEEGMRVVIFNAGNQVMLGAASGSSVVAVPNDWLTSTQIFVPENAAVLKVTDFANGQFRLVRESDGKQLTTDANGRNLRYAAIPTSGTDYGLWQLISVTNGFVLKSVNARAYITNELRSIYASASSFSLTNYTNASTIGESVKMTFYYECMHTNTTVTGAVAPTCTKSGKTGTTVCADCGASLATSSYMTSLGHDLGDFVSNDDGTHTQTCRRDGCTYTASTVCMPSMEVIAEDSDEVQCTLCGYQKELPRFTATTTLREGDNIVIYNPAYQVMMGCKINNSSQPTISIPDSFLSEKKVLVPDTAAVLTVTDLDNGQFRLMCNGKYLCANRLNLYYDAAPTEKDTDYSLWRLNTTGGLYLENITAESIDGDSSAQAIYCASDFIINNLRYTDSYQILIFSDNVTCPHSETTVSGAIAPTCTERGYTGDTVCADCGAILSTGEWSVSATGHLLGAYVSNGDGTHTQSCRNEGCTYAVRGLCQTTSVTAPCSICGFAGPQFTVNSNLQNGDKLVIYNPITKNILGVESGSSNYKVTAVTAPDDAISGIQLTVPVGAAILTVADLEDGQFHLLFDGKYLRAVNNSVVFADNPVSGEVDYGLWRLNTEIGLVIENVNSKNEDKSLSLSSYNLSSTFSVGTKGFSLGSDARASSYLMQIYTERVACTHTNIAPTPMEPPTCTQTGCSSGTLCLACGSVVTVGAWDIPALGHEWGENISNGNCTHTRSCERFGCTAQETTSCWTTPALTEPNSDELKCISCGYTWKPSRFDYVSSLSEGDVVVLLNAGRRALLTNESSSGSLVYDPADLKSLSVPSCCISDTRILAPEGAAALTVKDLYNNVCHLVCKYGGQEWYLTTDEKCSELYFANTPASGTIDFGLWCLKEDGDGFIVENFHARTSTNGKVAIDCSGAGFSISATDSGDSHRMKFYKCIHTNSMVLPVVAPTCTQEGYGPSVCTGCGTVITAYNRIPSLGHDWSDFASNGDGTHSQSCKNAGCALGETQKCFTFLTVDAEDDSLLHCSVCHEVYTAERYTITQDLQNGDSIVIYNPAQKRMMCASAFSNELSAGAYPDALVSNTQIYVPYGAAVLTVADMEDGKFHLKYNDWYLGSTQGGLGLVADSTDSVLWQLNTDNGLVIENSVAAWNGKVYAMSTNGTGFSMDAVGTTDKFQMRIYSDRVSCTHENTIISNAVAATCTAAGYSGDTCCADCGVMLMRGKTLKALGHDLSGFAPNNDGTHTKACQREDCTYNETQPCMLNVVGESSVQCSICGYHAQLSKYLASANLNEGDRIALYNTNSRCLMTLSADGTLGGIILNIGFASETQLLIHPKTAILTVTDLEDGQFHLVNQNGKYLTCNANGYGVSFAEAPAAGETDYALWRLNTNSGLVLENVNAEFNGKPQALVYNAGSFTTDDVGTTANYQMMIYMECGHINIATDAAVTPTCTATGLTEGSHCTDCGKIFVAQEEIAALDHDLVSHEAQVATCTEIGWDAYDTCSRCDYSTYQEIAALGHDIEHHNAQAATCTEIGWDAYDTCSRCDYSTYQEIAALDHDLVSHEAQAATCTEIGWDAYDTCSRCDYSTYQEIAALDHDLVSHEAQVATCTEIGWDAYDTCSRCDYSTYQEIAALGHDIEHHNAQAATCTEIGWDAYDTCSRCDYTTYQEIKAMGHTEEVIPAIAATCLDTGMTEGKKCTVCGEILIAPQEAAALGHAWDEGVVKIEPTQAADGEMIFTCTRCGEERTEAIAKLIDPCKGYIDINRDGWYHEAADFVIAGGYMCSTRLDALAFEPDTQVSRAMVATIMYRICNAPEVTYQGSFSDVPDGKWYSDGIEWCAQNGLAMGYNGKFSPDDVVTRQELAMFIFSLAEFLGRDTTGRASLSSFADDKMVAGWARTAMAWAVDYGLFVGVSYNGKTMLKPTSGATRAELAAILYRYLTK